MANEDWPDSRERLLKDIEAFSLNGPPKTVAELAALKSAPAQQAEQKPIMPGMAKLAPNAVQPAASVASATTQPAPAAAPASASGSLLDSLKQKAMAKLDSEQKQSSQQIEFLQRSSAALERAFLYLNDLARQLNILKPPYEKAYSFFGVVDFDGMNWEEGRADFRMQQVSSEDRFYEQVTMRYRLVSEKKFSVTRENPGQEKLRKALFDHNIAFTADEVVNDRGRVERATFTFPAEIKAGLMLAGNYETGELVMRTRNMERFGTMEFRMAPEAINHESLDELTRLILGQTSRIGQLLKRTA